MESLKFILNKEALNEESAFNYDKYHFVLFERGMPDVVDATFRWCIMRVLLLVVFGRWLRNDKRLVLRNDTMIRWCSYDSPMMPLICGCRYAVYHVEHVKHVKQPTLNFQTLEMLKTLSRYKIFQRILHTTHYGVPKRSTFVHLLPPKSIFD